MAVDRGGRNDKRQRRAFQRLAADALGALNLIQGPGISFDGDAIMLSLAPEGGLAFDPQNRLTVELDADPGLVLSADGLAIQMASGQPFSLAGGLALDLATSGGLVVNDGLSLLIAPGEPLILDADGLGVSLADAGGLEVATGELGVKVKADGGLVVDEDGLALGDGIEVTLADDGGLEYDIAEELRIKLPTDPDFLTDADGIANLYPRGRHKSIVTVSTGDAYFSAPGDLIVVLGDPGEVRGVFMPDAASCPGESVYIKTTGAAALQMTLATFNGESIDGIPATRTGPNGPLTVALQVYFVQGGSYVCTSDGSDWWITSGFENPGAFVWQRYDLSYTDFAAAATTGSKVLTASSMGGNNSAVFQAAWLHVVQQFAGTGITDVKLSVGPNGSPTAIYAATDVDVAPTRTAVQQNFVIQPSAWDVRAFATSTGANLNQLTQGRVFVYLLWGVMNPTL